MNAGQTFAIICMLILLGIVAWFAITLQIDGHRQWLPKQQCLEATAKEYCESQNATYDSIGSDPFFNGRSFWCQTSEQWREKQFHQVYFKQEELTNCGVN